MSAVKGVNFLVVT